MNIKSSFSIFDLIGTPQIKLSQLADNIIQLSDFFLDHPNDQTPWNEKFCQEAYRYYYLPLNYLRNHQSIKRTLQSGFFNGLENTIDWGSGPGTASLAISELVPHIKNQFLIDQSSIVFNLFSSLHKHLKKPQTSQEYLLKNLKFNTHAKNRTLLIFSYSLTEMNPPPEQMFEYDSIMILEPATQQDGRELLKLRENLIENNYWIWGPCTHQNQCPLLHSSQTDWCHDRIHVQAPKWFLDLEKLLPFKNKTITTSYLMASKRQPAENFKELNKKTARITGDSLEEKGKTRQLVCRSSDREFLAWMHKDKNVQVIPRGELIEMPTDYEKKSNELRVKSTIKIIDSNH